MKLNKADKIIMRKKIEELILNLNEDKRIHIDKDLLEDLLFDVYTEKIDYSDKLVRVKYLTWSGEFLQKIDLSEISFDNVMWDINYFEKHNSFANSVNRYEGIKSINLSNTNANIDFNEAYFEEKGIDSCVYISNCDFSNVDLSNNNFNDYSVDANNCDFSNTNLQIDFNMPADITLVSCNLTRLDFSQYTVDPYILNSVNCDTFIYAYDCNFTNTGIRTSILDEESPSKSVLEALSDLIKKGYLNGCYVNNKLILSKEAKKEIAEQKRKEYLEYKNNIFEFVEKKLSKQIGK